ncbi:hypothetical protein [Plastoroseomonas hellenica]|uniref:hypothetical protein n=1 Tax=Plastoroseomonas hellenica TaxID=2687306 RepID=UPI001BA5326A|nr:hypothetical protein [Plastoroseomonas hellenica]MBR0641596.1 hypothetical protein [Plastoroseomonas hellenica]
MISEDVAFRLLLTRLSSPARFVRLLAAREIGRLLSEDREGALRSTYLAWFASRPLETLVVDALVPIGLSRPRSWTDLSVLTRVERPSILLDIYLSEMFGRRPAFQTWLGAHGRRPPRTFEPPTDFASMSAMHTAPIVLNTLQRLDRGLARPFLVRQYAWEHSELVRRTGLPLSAGLDFLIDQFDDHVGGFESSSSALHLSALLRTIHLAMAEENMPPSSADYLAGLARPTHLELATVRAGTPPSVWPRFESDADADAWFDALAISGAAPYVEDAQDWRIASASALVHQSEERWYELTVRSVWAFEDPTSPAPFERELGLSNRRGSEPFLPKRISFPVCEEHLKFDPRVSSSTLGASAYSLPFAGRWHLDVILRCGVIPVLPFRHEVISVEYMPNGIDFQLEGKTFARWVHWYRNWTLSHPEGGAAASGAALLLSPAIIERIATRDNLYLIREACVEKFPRGRSPRDQPRQRLIARWPTLAASS